MGLRSAAEPLICFHLVTMVSWKEIISGSHSFGKECVDDVKGVYIQGNKKGAEGFFIRMKWHIRSTTDTNHRRVFAKRK